MDKLLEKKSFIFIFGIAFSFVYIHYYGYILDAALYLLQVVNFLHPERFVNDVPFMFGNQDAFTLYSPVISAFFKFLNVNTGGMVAAFLLQLGWCIGAISLIEKWMRHFGMQRYSAPIFVAFIFILSTKKYGCGFCEFPIIDPLLVARFFSEIFALFALAHFFDSNKYKSLILFLAASLFHPLMCGWGLPLWFFFHFSKTRIPTILVSALFPLTAFLHIGRFDIYSSDWLTKPFCYTPDWNSFLVYAGYLLFWITSSKVTFSPKMASFSKNMFWVSAIAFYFQYVSSFTGHIFLFQVQSYRVQWICAIPIIPIFAIYLKERLQQNMPLAIKDFAFIVLALCTVSQNHWLVLLALTAFAVFSPVGKKEFRIGRFLDSKCPFIIAGIIFLLKQCIENFLELSMQHGVGSSLLALKMMYAPDLLSPARAIALLTLSIICLKQQKYWFFLAFAISFCNDKMQILPLAAVLMYLASSLSSGIKQLLNAAVVTLAFAESLNALDKEPLLSVTLIVLFFCIVICGLSLWAGKKITGWKFLAFALISLLGVWDIFCWDARGDAAQKTEMQMDAFLEKTIFPQVTDRGKILFVVEGEVPSQSRFKFLTGAYADASIYIGEVFYKGQFMESNRRRSALLTGSPHLANLSNFEDDMSKIYDNPDSLMLRVNYLCGAREISHLATDYNQLPMRKIDSTYLEIKETKVYLYECQK